MRPASASKTILLTLRGLAALSDKLIYQRCARLHVPSHEPLGMFNTFLPCGTSGFVLALAGDHCHVRILARFDGLYGRAGQCGQKLL